MEIGKLNKRVLLQTYTVTENDMGDSISTWVDFATVWASATNLSGKEYFAAMQVQAENTIKFIIRYNKNVNETMRIIFEGNNYNIVFIDNIKYDNKFMEIKAMAVV